MEIHEARTMLEYDGIPQGQPSTWADLGCGSGTFTLGLAGWLARNSTVYAVDTHKSDLQKIPDQYNHVRFVKLTLDFVSDELPVDNLDGILMANSLHYVQHKPALLQKLVHTIKPDGRIMLVEYDTELANPWIPYPIPFRELKEIFASIGFSKIRKLNTRPSVYNRAPLYSALIER